MDKSQLVIVMPVFLLAIVELIRRHNLRDVLDFFSTEDMPDDLRNAEIALSEVDIYTERPYPMHGRIDQLYDSNGNYIIVDTKCSVRNRQVTLADTIQLSVYRTILINNGYPVSQKAYIRNVTRERSVRYIAVTLFTEEEIIGIYQKYQQISKNK